MHLTIVIGLLAAWAGTLYVRDGLRVPSVARASVKFTHALPAMIQATVFAYWASFWPEAFRQLFVIAVQLVVAYAFDFLLAWTLRRRYQLGLGPVPIVFSANLFVWFAPGELLLGTLVIAVALSSKVLIVRDGRHIFNPSVLGVSVAAALCILMPRWFTYHDISTDLGQPPYMPYLILGLALIPQIRLRTTAVSVGAVFAMLGIMLTVFALTGYKKAPSPWWPPWLLAITLLAPDPATIPAALIARFLFGLFVGASFYVAAKVFEYSFGTDYFAQSGAGRRRELHGADVRTGRGVGVGARAALAPCPGNARLHRRVDVRVDPRVRRQPKRLTTAATPTIPAPARTQHARSAVSGQQSK